MFLSFIHIWNILHLQQIKGMQSLNLGVWRTSPYKTLLSTPTSPPGPPHPRTPRAVSWIESHPVSRTAHKCLIRFFLSDYFSVFHCVMGLRLNLSLAEIWQKCYLFAEKLALRWGWKGSWERCKRAMTKHKLVMRSSINFRHCCERVSKFQTKCRII